MSPERFLASLERELVEHHLSQHEFYRSWNAGTIPLSALQGYAQQYYHFVALFPRLVSRIHSHMADARDRQDVLDNLIEEEREPLPHEELWIRFAEGIGVERAELAALPLPETKQTLHTITGFCERGFLTGAAAVLAYEAQISDIAELKARGLKKFYGVTSARTLQFFEVHGLVDREHQKTWKKILQKRALTTAAQTEAREALAVSLRGLWNLLDGVQRAYC